MQLDLNRRNSHGNFSTIVDSYESLGINVGKTYRNDFKIFCAIIANCIRNIQMSQYQKVEHFNLNLDTTTDAAGRPQEEICLRMVDDTGKL